MVIYRCKRCNYLYIEGEKNPKFNELNDDFKCPKCRASKHFFTKKD
ncbi:MAG: rubredoxin [Promethearchaeota archaeon]